MAPCKTTKVFISKTMMCEKYYTIYTVQTLLMMIHQCASSFYSYSWGVAMFVLSISSQPWNQAPSKSHKIKLKGCEMIHRDEKK